MTKPFAEDDQSRSSIQSSSGSQPDPLQEQLERETEALVVTSLMPAIGDLLRAAVAAYDAHNDAIAAEAEGLSLATAEDIAAAKIRRTEINAERQKKIKPLMDSIVKKLTAAEQTIRDMFEPAITVRTEATQTFDQKIAAAEQRLREEAERKRREAEEALRKEKEREERLAQEARDRAEAQRREAEEAERRAEKARGDRKRELEEEARHKRDLAAVNETRAQERSTRAESIEPEAVTVPVADTKVAGYSSRTKWKHRVTDLQAICRQIGEGTLSTDLVKIVAGEADALAKATKKTRTIEGFEFFEVTSGASSLKS